MSSTTRGMLGVRRGHGATATLGAGMSGAPHGRYHGIRGIMTGLGAGDPVGVRLGAGARRGDTRLGAGVRLGVGDPHGVPGPYGAIVL